MIYVSATNRKLTENDFDYSKKIHSSYEGIAYTKIYIENICKFYLLCQQYLIVEDYNG